LGISGVPFVGTDVGGFSGTPSPELYARWLQSAVFAPFFRTHTHYGSSDQEPWSFGENVEEISRKFITKRYEVLPYLYSLFWDAHQTGAPILRPLYFHHQNDPQVYDWAWQEQFLAGENLLVAPVTRVGQHLKKVYLPAGQWLDLNTEAVYEGGKTVIVDAPLDRLPMFLRSGGILPSQEAMQFVGEKPATKLILDIFSATASGSYMFYEDDGATFDHMSNKYRGTEFAFYGTTEELEFTKTRTHDHFQPAERLLQIRWHAVAAPVAISAGNTALTKIKQTESGVGYFYEAEKRILTVQFPDQGEQTLKIKF
jgi:alpha-glucosidase